MDLRAKETYRHKQNNFEIAVYRAKEDGHYRGYISAGGFSDLMGEISSTVASDLRETTGADPSSGCLRS